MGSADVVRGINDDRMVKSLRVESELLEPIPDVRFVVVHGEKIAGAIDLLSQRSEFQSQKGFTVTGACTDKHHIA